MCTTEVVPFPLLSALVVAARSVVGKVNPTVPRVPNMTFHTWSTVANSLLSSTESFVHSGLTGGYISLVDVYTGLKKKKKDLTIVGKGDTKRKPHTADKIVPEVHLLTLESKPFPPDNKCRLDEFWGRLVA